MIRVDIKPELLTWACQRAGMDVAAISDRFPQFLAWLSKDARPTFKQVEQFARATYTPVGFFFLPEPPVELVPIPDFRTVGNRKTQRPSPDLLDTVYLCQQRQDWYRDHARSLGDAPQSFVGSVKAGSNIERTSAAIRERLGLLIEERQQMPTFLDALRDLIYKADSIGVLVMCSGVVASNNRRKLNPDEFRGFAMSDPLAPLIFINGNDSKSAQMFTVVHELAHLWAGESAISDAQASAIDGNEVERWCNQVAAEVLVPLGDFRRHYNKNADRREEMGRLSRRFKVSTLVVLRRMHDAKGLSQRQFWDAYHEELRRLNALVKKGDGGNFYLTTTARVSKRFARALIASTLEGHTLHRDAFRMLGFSKAATLRELGRGLGVIS